MESKMPRVSVVMPVYNGSRCLRACLDSILAQTLNDIEVICVDDGSTDESPRILCEYAQRDVRVRVVRIQHSNAGSARNVGLRMAVGKWLSFLDSDDVFSPHLLEELVAAAEVMDADISTCRFARFDDGQEYADLLTSGGGMSAEERPAENSDIFNRWVGWAWDKLFRREFVLQNNLTYQELSSTNDLRFVFAALALANRVAQVDSVLVAHRILRTSIEATRKRNPENFIKALRSYKEGMDDRGVFGRNPKLGERFLKWVIEFSLWQLDSIGNYAANVGLRKCVRDLWRDLGLPANKCVLSSCHFTTRSRFWLVLYFPVIDQIYYLAYRNVVMNHAVRMFGKRVLERWRRR